MTDEEWLLFSKKDQFKDDALIQAIIRMERNRIIKEIEDAPPAMDFFGPYIAKEKLYALIQGDNE